MLDSRFHASAVLGWETSVQAHATDAEQSQLREDSSSTEPLALSRMFSPSEYRFTYSVSKVAVSKMRGPCIMGMTLRNASRCNFVPMSVTLSCCSAHNAPTTPGSQDSNKIVPIAACDDVGVNGVSSRCSARLATDDVVLGKSLKTSFAVALGRVRF